MITMCAVQLWYQYDTDGSGYIEADELKVRTRCPRAVPHLIYLE